MANGSYRDLLAWQQGIVLVKECYVATEVIPRREMFGVTGQLRRAIVSVPCNIAEGKGRRTDKDFRRHLRIANGSLFEAETLVHIAQELEFLSPEVCSALNARSARLGQLINGLLRRLDERIQGRVSVPDPGLQIPEPAPRPP